MKTTMNIFVAYAVLMVTCLIVSVSVSADIWAEAEANREQCISYCDGAYPLWSNSHSSCVGDCWKQFHKATGQGQGADGSDWITFPPKDEEPIMTAQPTGHGGFLGGGGGGGSNQQATAECQFRCGDEHINEDDYSACINECQSQASVQRTQIADIRIGDPQPTCGTDVWSCFHGGDDSPDVRNVDVGIFGVFADVRATTR